MRQPDRPIGILPTAPILHVDDVPSRDTRHRRGRDISLALRALAIWVALLIVAIANGFFRESLLISRLGARAAHLVSTFILCAAIIAVAYGAIDWIHPVSARDTVLIGIGWLVMTMAFELGFGRLRGRSWAELLADYDVSKGRVWILVLIALALAPYLAGRVRGTAPMAVDWGVFQDAAMPAIAVVTVVFLAQRKRSVHRLLSPSTSSRQTSATT